MSAAVVAIILGAALVAQTIGFIGAYRQLADDLRFERKIAREWRDRAFDLAEKHDALAAVSSAENNEGA